MENWSLWTGTTPGQYWSSPVSPKVIGSKGTKISKGIERTDITKPKKPEKTC